MITLQEIAYYLPKKVKIYSLITMNGNNYSPDEVKSNCTILSPDYIKEVIEGRFKLVLRPYDDLFKLIILPNKSLNPLDPYEFDPKEYFGHSQCDEIINCIKSQQVFLLPLLVVDKLLEWHFDIFGLIERGDAIDINTI